MINRRRVRSGAGRGDLRAWNYLSSLRVCAEGAIGQKFFSGSQTRENSNPVEMRQRDFGLAQPMLYGAIAIDSPPCRLLIFEKGVVVVGWLWYPALLRKRLPPRATSLFSSEAFFLDDPRAGQSTCDLIKIFNTPM